MAVLQFSCDTSNVSTNTEIVTLPMSVDMFYAPAITTEGNLTPKTTATVFRSASAANKILAYVDNPALVLIGYIVLTF